MKALAILLCLVFTGGGAGVAIVQPTQKVTSHEQRVIEQIEDMGLFTKTDMAVLEKLLYTYDVSKDKCKTIIEGVSAILKVEASASEHRMEIFSTKICEPLGINISYDSADAMTLTIYGKQYQLTNIFYYELCVVGTPQPKVEQPTQPEVVEPAQPIIEPVVVNPPQMFAYRPFIGSERVMDNIKTQLKERINLNVPFYAICK